MLKYIYQGICLIFLVGCTSSVVVNKPDQPETGQISPNIEDSIQVTASKLEIEASEIAYNCTKMDEQAGYKNVLPGITDSDELRDKMGEPDIIITSEEANGYTAEFGETVDYDNWIMVNGETVWVQDDIVIFIAVTQNQQLADIVERYGCPQAMYAIELGEHATDAYNTTIILYPSLGLRVDIKGTPPVLSSTDYITYYFEPVSLEEYFLNTPSLASATIKEISPENLLWWNLFR
ncbi:MAG TPA: hypothetical protein VLL52_10395 [Anaerolineae bacterium]|nr:hypothetical protein [Anaerolineae bacterium]